MAKIQRPNVIESENVISVTVRDEDRIEVFQANFQGLLSKVTRRIDNDGSPACSISTETRRRWSRGSSEVHVSQSQAIEGTPVEVPVPRKVSFMKSRKDYLPFVICICPFADLKTSRVHFQLANDKWSMTNGK
jgi:hypothetical protein